MDEEPSAETIQAVMRALSHRRKRSERQCRACGRTYVGFGKSFLCSLACQKRHQRRQAKERALRRLDAETQPPAAPNGTANTESQG